MVNKRCEDCQKKRPNFGMPDERKARWCHACSQKHEGAENVVSKRCEECKNKQPSYGMPSDNKQRWCDFAHFLHAHFFLVRFLLTFSCRCQPCSTKHAGAVNLVGKKKVGKQNDGVAAAAIPAASVQQHVRPLPALALHLCLGVCFLIRLFLRVQQETPHQPVAVIAEGLGPNQTSAEKRPLRKSLSSLLSLLSSDRLLVVTEHTAPVPVERPPEKRQAVAQLSVGVGGLQGPSPLTAQVAPQPQVQLRNLPLLAMSRAFLKGCLWLQAAHGTASRSPSDAGSDGTNGSTPSGTGRYVPSKPAPGA